MSELAVLSKANLLDSDKDSILAIVDNYIEDIAHEGGDILRDWIMCEKYALMIGKLKESLKPYIMDELAKYERNETFKHNCDMKVVNSATRYDFSSNEAWNRQKQIVDTEINKLKNIEDFIKSLKSEASIVDEDTGEIIKYYPPVKMSSETVRTTIK